MSTPSPFTSRLYSGPSVRWPVPKEFEQMVLPIEWQQKPTDRLYLEAQEAASRGPAAQITQAKVGIAELNSNIQRLGLDIALDPDDAAIVNKLSKDVTYWLRTFDITQPQLLGIMTWLQEKIKEGIKNNTHAFYLIIDYQNFYGCLRDVIGGGDNTHLFISELADILCWLITNKFKDIFKKTGKRIPIGIILCIHNHNFDPSSGFDDLIRRLNTCIRVATGYKGDIIIAPTHNRSSFDDLLLFIAAQQVFNIQKETQEELYQELYTILTSDELRDMKGKIASHFINTQGINELLMTYYRLIYPLSNINKYTARDKISDIKLGIARRPNPRRIPVLSHGAPSHGAPYTSGAPYHDRRLRGPDPRPPGPTHYYGGTIKYKKSLATKRSRKVYKKTYKKTYKKHKTIKRKIKRKL